MKRVWIIAVILLVPSVLLDLFVVEHHEAFPGSNILGFFSVYGFLGCIVIIVVSKFIGHYWLQKKEDYYDRDDGDN